MGRLTIDERIARLEGRMAQRAQRTDPHERLNSKLNELASAAREAEAAAVERARLEAESEASRLRYEAKHPPPADKADTESAPSPTLEPKPPERAPDFLVPMPRRAWSYYREMTIDD